MKVIGGNRRSGRTMRLIELCAESELGGKASYIVCHTEVEARRIFELAMSRNMHIPFPITHDEFRTFRRTGEVRFFVDNAEYLFKRLLDTPYDIEAIAITTDEILTREEVTSES